MADAPRFGLPVRGFLIILAGSALGCRAQSVTAEGLEVLRAALVARTDSSRVFNSRPVLLRAVHCGTLSCNPRKEWDDQVFTSLGAALSEAARVNVRRSSIDARGAPVEFSLGRPVFRTDSRAEVPMRIVSCIARHGVNATITVVLVRQRGAGWTVAEFQKAEHSQCGPPLTRTRTPGG